MPTDVHQLVALDDSFARDVPELVQPWRAAPAPAPELLVLNDALAADLDLDSGALRAPGGVALLVGNAVPEGVTPVALVYAGHQFGGYSPRLGDGRALLLGEVVDGHGRRWDLHLKGSGRTPFARGGDGKAAVGPMLREYVVAEAMHALGIPTTRSLAVVATGEAVERDTMLPGAVLARVAASHIRVGTFEFAARHPDPTLVRRLADHAIARHHPGAADADEPYLAFLEAVVAAQASLVARWMLVGFIHGVMNTDNMTISGETIDYGPCAFMDRYDPATVFSSIDHGGRYAYGNQPPVAQWNLARLAETLLPLLDDDERAAAEKANAVLRSFGEEYEARRRVGMLAKLGIDEAGGGDDDALAADLLVQLQRHGADFTSTFRALAAWLRGAGDAPELDGWTQRWRDRVLADGRDAETVAAAMDAVNPVYIPRNHLVEEALAAATAGDMSPFHQLVEVLTRPFDARPGLERYAEPSPTGSAGYQTFCGT